MSRALLTQFWAMFHTNLKLVYRNPMMLGVLVLMPFLLIAIVSQAFSPIFEGAASFDVPAVDLDRSEQSQRLTSALDETPSLHLRLRDWDGAAFTEADARDVFGESRDNFVVFVIPKGFGESLASGSHITLTLYSDPVQKGFSGIILDEVRNRLLSDALIAAFARVLTAEGVGQDAAAALINEQVAPLVDAPPVTVEQAFVSKERALPSNFEQTVPGFSVMFTFWLAGIIASSIYAEKRLYRTWQRTLVAPVPRWAVLASRIAAYVALGLAQMGVLFTLGWALFGMDIGSDVPALLAVLVSVALVTTTLGFLMSGLFRDVGLMNMTTNLLVLVLAGIGGAIVPTFFLPRWARALSPLTPHYWAMDAIQHIIILGDGFTSVLPQIGVLLGFAALFFAAGLYRFRFAD